MNLQVFIFIRRIGFFLDYDIDMRFKKLLIVERNIPYNAKTVGYNTKFKGIAEMPIDIHLLNGWIGSRMGGHRGVGSFIRVIGIVNLISFFKGFQLFF
ncbi:hypothetical protein OXPF_33440 [Oxobacter pfennigii]|uniref:Uncharacterized protein n=1 Tax=Oxobacter pfennigii TaxID=36849 RepID=A0A0P8WXM0_9CLOT|nr:hypothetical protein OXPF_33440 [Oxobacter pfennigii]